MDIKRLERRDSSMDLIRIVAVFLVMSVHFLYHTYTNNPAVGGTDGFYHLTVEGLGPVEGVVQAIAQGNPELLHGPLFFLMIFMKTLFSACVPLFMILTGYLLSGKTLSRKYYKGIRKILIIFVLASIACMFFKSIHDVKGARDAFYRFDLPAMFEEIAKTGKYGIKEYILSIFDYSGANYSWYVEMYIGLFLMAPFLNLAYHKLGSKRKKQVLVGTFVFLMILPSLFNIFQFTSAEWWLSPAKSGTYQKLIPAFWVGAYPVAFYFTGMYIREYGVKLKTRSMAALLCILLFLFTAFNFYRSYGEKFQSGAWIYWYGFQPYVVAVLLFVLLSRVRANNWNPAVRTVLWKVSDLTFGMYLLSFIFDKLIYTELNKHFLSIFDKVPFYFLTVPLCFVCSLTASFIVTAAAKGLMKLFEKIKVFAIAQKARGDRKKWQDFLFIALMVAALLFCFWKMRYGFGGNDEAFYLTIPHRLTMGDALFVDEWHLSQMCSVLLLPFVWLFTTITGSTEGIMLAARVFYILVHCAAASVIYVKLRRFGYFSVVACVLFFLYTPYNIMALSYDSMSMGLMALSGVLLATADYSKKLQIIFSGLAFAGAVLCAPYLAAVYVLFALCMGIHVLLRKKDMRFVLKSEMFSVRTFLFFTLGVGIPAVVFLLFTVPRAGISGIAENLPKMLNDPEHPYISFGQRLYDYFNSIFRMQPHFKYAIYSYCAMLLVMIIDRKRRLHRAVYLLITAGVVIYSYILILPELHKSTYNSIMFPLIFVGITAYILCKNKPRELFAAVFTGGILYSFCIYYPSNQYFYVISMAFAVVNLASLMFLAQLIHEMQESPDNITYAVWVKRLSFAAVALMIVVQAGCQIGSKARHCFWDNEPDKLNYEFTEGPAAGIYTDQTKAEQYQEILNDIQGYESKEEGNLLVLSERTWIYLAADMPYGTYSAWLSGEKPNSINRLLDFYALNPDKKPRYIYVPDNSKWDMTWLIGYLQSRGFSDSKTPAGHMLEKIR